MVFFIFNKSKKSRLGLILILHIRHDIKIAQSSNGSGLTIDFIAPLNEKAKDQTINIGYK